MLCTCAFVSRKKARKLLTSCKLQLTKQQSLALRVTWTVCSKMCSFNMSNCLQAMGFAEMRTMWWFTQWRFLRWSHWQGQKQDHGDPGDSGRRGWRGSKEEGRRKEEAPETSRKTSCNSPNACWNILKAYELNACCIYIFIDRYMYTCLTGIKTISHVWRELFPVYLSYLDFDLDPPPHLLKLAFSG